MARIVLLSNSGGRYGYSVVAEKVTAGLSAMGHKIFYIGMQNLSPPYKDELNITHIPIGLDPWGSDRLYNTLKITKPDFLITILDTWHENTNYIRDTMLSFPDIYWVSHVTINTEPVHPAIIASFKTPQHLVAPSEFNFQALRSLGIKYSTLIPHGVHTDLFKPIQGMKEEMKKRLNLENKFVYLCVARNRGMLKGIRDLLVSYKQMLDMFPETKENTALLLLSDPTEQGGVRLDTARQQLGMIDNVCFVWLKLNKDESSIEATYEGDPDGMKHDPNIGFGEEEMVKLYNLADCHVSFSPCESFCLPVLESMSCGTPQIFGNHSTGIELVGKGECGFLVNSVAKVSTSHNGEVFVLDRNHYTDCMFRMYKEKDLREKFSSNGRKNSLRYDWKNILPLWGDLINRLYLAPVVDYGNFNRIGL